MKHLDLLLQSCQYWLSESKKTSSAMDALVEQHAFKLCKELWPDTDLEIRGTLSPGVRHTALHLMFSMCFLHGSVP